MLKRRLLLSLVTALGLFASQAQAGTLTSATWNGDFQGVPYTLSTLPLGGLVGSGTAAGTGATATAAVAITVTPKITLSTTLTQVGTPFVRFTLQGAQNINIGAGNVASATGTPNMGAPGQVKVWLGGAAGTVNPPLFTIPVNVGGTGMATIQTKVTLPVLGTQLVSVTVTFLGWQINPFLITGLTGFSITVPTPGGGTAMISPAAIPVTGTNNLVNGVGSVTLVAPSRVHVCVGGKSSLGFGNCNGGIQESTTPGITTLKMTFVPEPSTLLLLGAGLLGLGFVGRRSSR